MRYKHYLYVLIPKKRGQKPGMKRCKMWKRTILYVKIGKTKQKTSRYNNIVYKKQTNIMILIIWKLRIQNNPEQKQEVIIILITKTKKHKINGRRGNELPRHINAARLLRLEMSCDLFQMMVI